MFFFTKVIAAWSWFAKCEKDPVKAQLLKESIERILTELSPTASSTTFGLLDRWYHRYGPAAYFKATSVSRGCQSNRRQYGYYASAYELETTARALKAYPGGKSSIDTWEHPIRSEIRTAFLKEGEVLGRPRALSMIHLALATKCPVTFPALSRSFRELLSERTIEALVQFRPTPVVEIVPLVRHLVDQKVIPHTYAAEVLHQWRSDYSTMLKNQSKSSGALAKRVMAAQAMDVGFLADLFALKKRGRCNLIHDCIFAGKESVKYPFGVLALIIARNPAELTSLVNKRRFEIEDNYRRRTGQPIDPRTREGLIWGVQASKSQSIKSATYSYMIGRKRAAVAVRHLIERFMFTSPEAALAEAVSRCGSLALWARAHSSHIRIMKYVRGVEIPALPEYQILLRAGAVSFTPAHEVSWRDCFAKRLCKLPRTKLGAIQTRIAETLIAESSRHRSKHFVRVRANPTSAQYYFSKLAKEGELHATRFRWVLDHASGLKEGDPRRTIIGLILKHKDYSLAFAEWIRSGGARYLSSNNASLLPLYSASPNMFNGVLEQHRIPSELARLRLNLPLGRAPNSADDERGVATSPWHSAHIASALEILRLFPGMTLEELFHGISLTTGGFGSLLQTCNLETVAGTEMLFIDPSTLVTKASGLDLQPQVSMLPHSHFLQASLRPEGALGLLLLKLPEKGALVAALSGKLITSEVYILLREIGERVLPQVNLTLHSRKIIESALVEIYRKQVSLPAMQGLIRGLLERRKQSQEAAQHTVFQVLEQILALCWNASKYYSEN